MIQDSTDRPWYATTGEYAKDVKSIFINLGCKACLGLTEHEVLYLVAFLSLRFHVPKESQQESDLAAIYQ